MTNNTPDAREKLLQEACRETLRALTCGQAAIVDTVWVAAERNETLFDCVADALGEPEFSESLIEQASRATVPPEPTPDAREKLLDAQVALDPATPPLRIAVEQAVHWFADYAKMHSAKKTEDGDRKAKTNQERADYLAAALAAHPEPTADAPGEGQNDPMLAHCAEDARVEEELFRQRTEAGGWTGLAAELFILHRSAYPAPWCWEQCGDKCDDPVIGAAWWEDDESCTPIAGELVPPDDNIERAAYREPIALEMQSHADGSANANARLIVWLRNHVTEILNGLAALRTQSPDAVALLRLFAKAETPSQAWHVLANNRASIDQFLQSEGA